MEKQYYFAFPNLSNGDWSIICDFDGTITPFDVTDAILEKFASPTWEEIEEEWVSGNIDARECMERQIALIRAPLRSLNAFLDSIPITPGFREFIKYCERWNHKLAIVSDGMDYAIRRILDSNNVPGLNVVANHLVYKGNDTYALEFPHGLPNCPSGVCKCTAAKTLAEMTLLIGDGRSDCCLAREASFTLVKKGKELHAYCEESDFPYGTYDNFFDVIARFETAMRRDSGKQAPSDHVLYPS